MKIELTEQQFRYLLDLVYIGNWVINSTREDDRIKSTTRWRVWFSPTACSAECGAWWSSTTAS